jgi:hypothetical protein
VKFTPHFVNAIQHVSAEVANVYITTGELILDVALLRALDDYVADETVHAAMEKINRDESRHIAIDYYMVEYYASDEYKKKRVRHSRPLRDRAKAWSAFGRLLLHARPFFRDVFFYPMERIDPSGSRLREAFKRMQLLTAKPAVAELPFVRFMQTLQNMHNSPHSGPRLRAVIARVAGSEPRFLQQLASDEEMAQARAMSFDALAAEALAAKRS